MTIPGTVIVRHSFVSLLEDSEEAAAAGELVPSNWNGDGAHEVVGAAPIDSPEFLNEPTAPTPPRGDRSKRLATTEFLDDLGRPQRLTLTAAGDVTLADDIGLVIAKKTVPAAFRINLPLSTNLVPEFVTIKDRMLANGAGAGTFNITVAAQGAETIDGNPSVKIDVDNMALSFRKIRDDAGNVTGEGYELV
jgi:hypothetical protein